MFSILILLSFLSVSYAANYTNCDVNKVFTMFDDYIIERCEDKNLVCDKAIIDDNKYTFKLDGVVLCVTIFDTTVNIKSCNENSCKNEELKYTYCDDMYNGIFLMFFL